MKRQSLALLLVLLAGCSSPKSPPVAVDPTGFSGHAIDQVMQQFGKPQQVTRLDSLEVYEYRDLETPGSGIRTYSFLVEHGQVIESTPGTLQLYREDGITKVRAQAL